MKKWPVLIVALLFLAALPAVGETTGNDVLAKCQTALRAFDNNGGTTEELADTGWCTGWVSATLKLTQLHNEWTDFVKEKPKLLQFCLPDPGIPVIQAIRVVVKNLKEHPEQLHDDGMGLTVAALKESFPCK